MLSFLPSWVLRGNILNSKLMFFSLCLCYHSEHKVVKPMAIERLLDQEVKFISGGELQRLAIILALGKPAVRKVSH